MTEVYPRRMKKWAALKVRIDCPECGGAVMIDAPLPSVSCTECHASIPLVGSEAESLWPWIVANALRSAGSAEAFVNDSLLNTGAVVPFVYLASHRGAPPRCRCGASMAHLESVPYGSDGQVACLECNAPCRTWANCYADADGDETRFQVFMTRSHEDSTGAADPVVSKPVVFACPSCGSNLPIDTEATRIITCEYCDSDAFLPPQLWNHLHPVRRRSAFWIRADE